MFRYTLNQLRTSVRQLTAAALAILIATAFLTAGLAASAVVKQTTIKIVSDDFAQADLVITPFWLDPEAADAVRGIPGVKEAYAPATTSSVASHDDIKQYVNLGTVAPTAGLEAWPVDHGQEPAQAGEVALAQSIAERLGLALGDQFTLTFENWQTEDYQNHAVTVTLVGTFDDSGPFMWLRADARTPLATFGEAQVQHDFAGGGSALWSDALLIMVDPDVEMGPGSTLRQAIGQALDDYAAGAGEATAQAEPDVQELLQGAEGDQAEQATAGAEAAAESSYSEDDAADATESLIQTRAQAAAARAADYLDSDVVLTIIGLVFGGLALLVAALVIANTFQVLIASRARTLALLRCVGATKDQVRRSVLIESLLVGVGASVLGVALGGGLVQLALLLAGRRFPSIPIPGFVGLPLWLVMFAILAGTGTTLLAALAPARLATKVAPVEALRPQGVPTVRTGAGRARLLASAALTLAGAALLTYGVWFIRSHPEQEYGASINAVLAGLLGGALAAVGILLGTVFWLPKVVGWLAKLLTRTGAGARLAAANSVRQPRRTAATATALLIGVTLVSAMTVGAACMAKTMNNLVYTYWPIDIEVGQLEVNSELAADDAGAACGLSDEQEDWYTTVTWGNADTPPLTEAEVAAAQGVDGLGATALLYGGTVTAPDASGLAVDFSLAGADPDAIGQVMNRPEVAQTLADGEVAIGAGLAGILADARQVFCMVFSDTVPADSAPAAGDAFEVTVTGPAGQQTLTFRYVPGMDTLGVLALVDQATLEALVGPSEPQALWATLDDDADPVATTDRLQNTMTDLARNSSTVQPVGGSAVERADTLKTIDTMLLVGLALLAVSVLVALIGVANTLSLSVIERRRETAVLRALGLTRGQTRWMMAVEGMVIAGVAGLCGVVIGAVYGWAATALVAGYSDDFALALPVGRLALILALSVVAGLVASVLPGRRAAQTPPAAARAPA
ncbi:MAG: ABC transporter permease [Bifidobacteriaceae bacterium]|jgi:putative ABC transport system permease protein|nr:ABC transporter permease [Bifidobacteriaceae bacterium]